MSLHCASQTLFQFLRTREEGIGLDCSRVEQSRRQKCLFNPKTAKPSQTVSVLLTHVSVETETKVAGGDCRPEGVLEYLGKH